MIKFFRKIRYNLMETGKTAKYFKYAIGEIILVVIGILIALQINNWNEHRKLKTTEKIVLNDLIEDLKLDYIEFKKQDSTLNRQLTLVDALILNPSSIDLTNTNVDIFRFNAEFFPVTFENNIPEGISNKKIIEILKKHYRTQQIALADQQDYAKVVKEMVRPFLRKHAVHNPKAVVANVSAFDLKLLNTEKFIELLAIDEFGQILFELRLKTSEFIIGLNKLIESNEKLLPEIESYIKQI